MICHYCQTEYDENERCCPMCHRTPSDKTGAGNGLKPKPVTVRISGFPLKTNVSPNPPNPQHRFHKA
jgi:hypothetical protein